MAQFPSFSVNDLPTYSGRPDTSYPVFSDEFINQAVLLFKLATCLEDWPDDPTLAQLAHYAIVSMADSLLLAQPFAVAAASPFSSESIGSYSYSKLQATAKGTAVSQGLPTGESWFDMAVQRLGVCDTGARVERGSIAVFEQDIQILTDENGDRWLPGPATSRVVDVPLDIQSDQTYVPDQPR